LPAHTILFLYIITGLTVKCPSVIFRADYQVDNLTSFSLINDRKTLMTMPRLASSIAGIYRFEKKSQVLRPLFFSGVSAGFPSPADDYIDRELDLNEYLVANPAATFFVRVAGDSMINAGINHDDILIVDRSLEPISGKIIIAIIDGELTVKRLIKTENSCRLVAENPRYPHTEILRDMELEVWGVVTCSIHRL